MSAGTVPRGGDRVEAADLGRHNNNTERSDGATLAANTAIDARGGSPQGAHLSGAATPRPPRSRRRLNQNGLDTTQVRLRNSLMNYYFTPSLFLEQPNSLVQSNLVYSFIVDLWRMIVHPRKRPIERLESDVLCFP